MSAQRASKKKTKTTNGNPDYEVTWSTRMSEQEKTWLKQLAAEQQREHGVKANESSVVRSLIRKAAKAAGLEGA